MGRHGGQRGRRPRQHGLAHHVRRLPRPSGPRLPRSAAVLWCADAGAEERWEAEACTYRLLLPRTDIQSRMICALLFLLPRGAAHFRRQEGGGDPRLFHLVCGANQRAPLEARARERRTNLQRQLGDHRLLPVALRQAAPQRDGPHSHTPHTLYILLKGCGVCSSCVDASSWDEAKLISGPNVWMCNRKQNGVNYMKINES